MKPGESRQGRVPCRKAPVTAFRPLGACHPGTGKLPFAGILLFHANLPRTAFGRRFGNLTLTTDVGKTCWCERSGHFSY